MKTLLIKTLLASKNREIIRIALPACIRELVFDVEGNDTVHVFLWVPGSRMGGKPLAGLPFDFYKEFYWDAARAVYWERGW